MVRGGKLGGAIRLGCWVRVGIGLGRNDDILYGPNGSGQCGPTHQHFGSYFIILYVFDAIVL